MTVGVEVIIGADTSELDEAVKGSKGSLVQLSDEMKKGIATAAKYGAAAAAAGAAIGAGLVVKGLRAVDAQAKLAARLDATADGLRAVQIAAIDAGVEVETFNDAADNLNERIGEAQTGAGIAADAFKFLGLEAAKLEKLDTDERFLAIAERLDELNVTTAQASFLLAELGIEEKRIINLMMDGGEAIKAARKEVELYGLSLSEVDANKVEMANQAFSKIGLVVDGIAQQMAVEMAPVIAVVSELFLDVAASGRKAGEDVARGLEESEGSAITVLNSLTALKRSFNLVAAVGSWAADRIKVGFLSFADSIVNEPIDSLNKLIDLINKIPGFDIERSELPEIGKSIREGLSEAIKEMAGSSTDLQKAFEKMTAPFEESEINRKLKSFEERVKESVETIGRATSGIDLTGLGQDDGGEGANNNLQKELERRLEVIRESNMTERELAMKKFAQEDEDLRLALENELLTREEYNILKQEQHQRAEEAITAIEAAESEKRKREAEQEAKAKERAFSGFYSNLRGLMGSNSKKLFQIGKAAALANATIDGYAAITGAYKVGARIGGPPVGAAFAAAAGAATFAQIQKIRSTQFGGGGGNVASSVSDSGASAASAAQSQQAQPSGPAGGTLTVTGLTASSLLTGDAVAGLANELLEYQRRGGTVVLAE